MIDQVTVTSKQSWFQRLGGALRGVVTGLILFVVAFPLLFWNEGRSVKTYKTLKEGAAIVVSVGSGSVDPANEEKLVHMSGEALTEEILKDVAFGVEHHALRLQRAVEMYQWIEKSKKEEKKKVGGSTETVETYSYEKGWSDRLISSAAFKSPDGHKNPGAFPYKKREINASRVTLGAFLLAPSQVRSINNFTPLVLEPDLVIPSNLPPKTKVHDGLFYMGKDPAQPNVGDVKVRFEVVNPGPVSIIAQQVNNTFQPYLAKTGQQIEKVSVGTVTAEAMFEKAQAENRILTWILRLVGFFIMGLGLKLIIRPLTVFADVVPFLGNLAEMGLGFICFTVAAVGSLLTIAVAWIFYRPFLAIALILVASALVVWTRKRVKARLPAASPPAPDESISKTG